MNEMSERVARALYAARYETPVGGKPIPALLWDTPLGIRENMCNEGNKEECRRHARAAVVALEEAGYIIVKKGR